jgi:hypothetical protein
VWDAFEFKYRYTFDMLTAKWLVYTTVEDDRLYHGYLPAIPLFPYADNAANYHIDVRDTSKYPDLQYIVLDGEEIPYKRILRLATTTLHPIYLYTCPIAAQLEVAFESRDYVKKRNARVAAVFDKALKPFAYA